MSIEQRSEEKHFSGNLHTSQISVPDVQEDWKSLDSVDFVAPADVRLISHESFTPCPDIHVRHIQPSAFTNVMWFWKRAFELLYAIRLFRATDTNTVLIVNGGVGLIWLYVGLLNQLFHRRRRVLCWDVFVEVEQKWKQRIVRAAMRGFDLSVLWSKDQINSHARFLGMPEERFVFLPFKANHSKGPRYDLPLDNFVFAGGNGKRDYRCLIEAVRDTNIPLIVSSTAPDVRRQIDRLPNVIVLAAPEPAFAQLQAASRFVVIPMNSTGLKGGGEANFCNAMWHGKPIIAADDISARDYIVEGVTGYVVPSGDSKALRARILELWNDPAKAAVLGQAGRRHVEQNFMHDQFIRRLLRLALIVGQGEIKNTPRNSGVPLEAQCTHANKGRV